MYLLFYYRFADTWCDDGNNNIGCHFDGGDCCGKNVKKNYCNECQCKACGVQSWYEILDIINGGFGLNLILDFTQVFGWILR